MIKSGLTSVTFRKLSAEAIIKLSAKAELNGIEWGGDIHAPHGDTATAKRIGGLTRDAGLEVSSYGSYYKVGVSEDRGLPFAAVLASAVTLEAPVIRVWAGEKSPEKLSPDEGKRIIADTVRIAEAAKAEGVKIAFEYHPNTVTENNFSAFLFGRALASLDNIAFYWQPPKATCHSYCKEGLASLIGEKLLGNIHVFAWQPDGNGVIRLSLAEHDDRWREYLSAAESDGKDRYALLEFVKNDSEASFYEDAAELKRILM